MMVSSGGSASLGGSLRGGFSFAGDLARWSDVKESEWRTLK